MTSDRTLNEADKPFDTATLGELRAELKIEQSRSEYLQREVARGALATANAEADLKRALELVSELQTVLNEREAQAAALRTQLGDTQKRAGADAPSYVAPATVSQLDAVATAIGDTQKNIGGLLKGLNDLRATVENLSQRVDAVGVKKREPNLGLSRWFSFAGTAAAPAQPRVSQRDQQIAIEASQVLDGPWYLARYPDVASSGVSPVEHYVAYGWKEGRDPSANFSTEFYLRTNPQVRAAGVCPLYHYVVAGRYQGRAPSPNLEAFEIAEQAAVVAAEFDVDFYRGKSGLNLSLAQAIDHYMRKGWREGRDPHPQFSTRYYLRENPDVRRANINPYAHYLVAGRREGRLPREFPGLSVESVEQWRVVARSFDVPFYRERHADVVDGRFEPILHYLLDGWRQLRDPSPDFSTAHYLDNNADVREAGVNPFFHYLAEGSREGRSPRPAGDWTPRNEVKKIVGAHFDPDFYRARNPDVAKAKFDPLDHFLDFGWKEGRDPNAEFCTRHYLDANEDVVAAGVNPFYHYLVSGRTEGRAGRHPGGWRAMALQRLLPLEDQFELQRAEALPAGDIVNSQGILAAVRASGHRKGDRIFLTVSHDDYTTSVGGVQLCLKLEELEAASRGITHINVHPVASIGALSRDTSGTTDELVVTCKGKAVGVANVGELIDAIENLSRDAGRTDLAVHSLLAHSPEAIVKLHAALAPARSFLWLHDYFSICPSYTLLRNGISFCGAPSPESASCTVCVFGDERRRHLERFDEIFAHIPFEVIAPSEFAAEFWRSNSKLSGRKCHVQNHCILHASPERAPRATGPVRVAFTGHPSPHKGWEAFLVLLRELKDDPRYEFHHLGAGARVDNRTTFARASVLEDGPNAMIDALIRQKIDIVLLWSIWPETFSFVAHEAVCAGAPILTSETSGNIARLVRQRSFGSVFDDEQALLRAFTSGRVYEMAVAARAKPPSLYVPEFSKMTLALID